MYIAVVMLECSETQVSSLFLRHHGALTVHRTAMTDSGPEQFNLTKPRSLFLKRTFRDHISRNAVCTFLCVGWGCSSCARISSSSFVIHNWHQRPVMMTETYFSMRSTIVTISPLCERVSAMQSFLTRVPDGAPNGQILLPEMALFLNNWLSGKPVIKCLHLEDRSFAHWSPWASHTTRFQSRSYGNFMM